MNESPVEPDAFNAFEAEGWEGQATGYEEFFGPITTRLVEPLLDDAQVDQGKRVLDVASGPGYVAARAAQRRASVVGVDVAEAMLSLARRLHPQVAFRPGNAEDLAFPDASFDAVVGNFILLHLGRPEQAASEFARVLEQGGKLALTVWDVPERCRVLGVLVDAIAAAGATPPAGLPVGPPFFRFADDDEFARLLREEGFEEIQVRTISFVHSEPSADALWRGLMAGTVRTSAIILGQTEEMQRDIRAAFDRIVQKHQVGSSLELPVSVKLASGRKRA